MFERVLVATDGSGLSEKAIELAAQLAARDGADLDVVHVQLEGPVPESLQRMVEIEHLVEPASDQPLAVLELPGSAQVSLTQASTDGASGWKIANAVGQEILTRAKSTARDLGVETVQTHLENGGPVKAILAIAAKRNSDLVVIGSRGLGQLERLVIGSVSQAVVRDAKCTCITVK